MVSAVNTQTFANKKPNLLGNVSASFTDIIRITAVETGTTNVLTAPEELRTSRIITYAGTTNIGFVEFFQKTEQGPGGQTGGFTLRIREDDLSGAILDSVIHTSTPNTIFNDTLNADITNESVGSKTYVLTWESDFSAGVARSEYSTFGGAGVTVEIDDTNSTKNTNIIGG